MIKFVHVNIITDNWQKLADFYIKVFGCKPIYPERNLEGTWLDSATNIDKAHIKGVHLALPGSVDNLPTLEIFQYSHNENNLETVANRKGFGHIAFKVENVIEIVNSIIENGGALVGEIVKTEIENVGQLTFAYTKDPDGNIIEIQNWK